MYFSSLFSVGMLAMASLVAGDYALTSPINAIWEAGSSSHRTETGGSPTPVTIELALMTGPPTQMQLLYVIQQSVDAKGGQYKWQIPQDLPAGKQYAIRSGTGPNVKYTPYFEIKSNAPSGSTSNAPPEGDTAPKTNKPNDGATMYPWLMPIILPASLILNRNLLG
ncbi:hypothetical protein K493DRAFT_298397 [Basidiobolus meristosporus CBS 931.73]|uniref:Yeast cell wall synthesis Kre9/Knh1-like N-terminal domain-containing protein n=1 Tax=Basidiobolus meristosporus CBS 931.73 TaxID=1314790 RepID=A0A1Y1YTM8_9FUNG|nr:hypothetical protein K493DRAFT_298397 [Basidiobolus meristosporus CBS 931.73]|eukprot:ORY01393.1 hypothetical protein K493DRAFT_298397 [Basidiobolus meristosporus CBS 931.73]